MSFHCSKCQDNFYAFYDEFFRESNLFQNLAHFSDNQVPHEQRRNAWSRAHSLVMEALQSVGTSLKSRCNFIRFTHIGLAYTSQELEQWILSYICEDCWNSQPLPYPTFFYFFSPIAADIYYVIDCSLDFVEKEPEFKKNCLNFLVTMKNRNVCRNGLVSYGFESFNYYYERIAGFPIYLHNLTTREEYEIRKKGRFAMEIECHPLASHGLLWEQLEEMFDEDGTYITNY